MEFDIFSNITGIIRPAVLALHRHTAKNVTTGDKSECKNVRFHNKNNTEVCIHSTTGVCIHVYSPNHNTTHVKQPQKKTCHNYPQKQFAVVVALVC